MRLLCGLAGVLVLVATLSLATLRVRIAVLLPALLAGHLRGGAMLVTEALGCVGVPLGLGVLDELPALLGTRFIDEHHHLAAPKHLALVELLLHAHTLRASLVGPRVFRHLSDGQHEREARVRHAPCAVCLFRQLVERDRVRIVVLILATDRFADDLQVADERVVQLDLRAAMAAQISVGLRDLHHGRRRRNLCLLSCHFRTLPGKAHLLMSELLRYKYSISQPLCQMSLFCADLLKKAIFDIMFRLIITYDICCY